MVASLAFQHANHSVRVSDEFMRLALSGGPWALRAVTTGEVLETVPARRVLRACAEAAARCGDPGLQFADQIARWHTCPNTGPITASNPCGEFLHVADSACNLATLNLLAFLKDREFDIEGFTAAVELLVLAQDAIVDGSGYPSREIERNAHGLRQIGIGYANLAALLLTLGIPYDSDEGRDWAAAITALMTGVAYRRSAELAAALGPFAEFEANREPMLRVIERHGHALDRLGGEQPAEVLRAARGEWTQALELGRKHGFRNAQTTLIPPTGTVSLMLDCETTGIEPYYALTTIKHFADGGVARLSSRVVVDALAALGHTTATIETLSEYALDHGHLANAPGLRDDERLVFQTATGSGALSPMAHLQMVAAVQPFLSGGVSKTVPLPFEAGVEAIEERLHRLLAPRPQIDRRLPRRLQAPAATQQPTPSDPPPTGRSHQVMATMRSIGMRARCDLGGDAYLVLEVAERVAQLWQRDHLHVLADRCRVDGNEALCRIRWSTRSVRRIAHASDRRA